VGRESGPLSVAMTGERGQSAAIEPSGSELITREELQLATRNHGMPLEALRYAITPVGLHYLLVHYDIPVVNPATWRLVVNGRVGRPLTMSLEELRALPSTTVVSTMECAGNGRAALSPRPVSQPWLLEAVGTGQWRGVSLKRILDAAGLLDGAAEVVFTGIDSGIEGGVEQSYARSLSVGEALRDEVILAYELNRAPLPPQHGFPVRLVVPGWYGMTNVKWLSQISVVMQPFDGYQQVRGYHRRSSVDDPGTPLTRMMPRALMVPPGIPEFMTRGRRVLMEPHRLEGRAWSGWGAITGVEVSTDGGSTWKAAEFRGDPVEPWAWRGWSFQWTPSTEGDVVLCCRARDEAGNVQPTDMPWNVGGYANNAVQRVPVRVVSS
jgi:DMSO/TMAO reductase YedYZ molybdopterin-dependent catalytic subunit